MAQSLLALEIQVYREFNRAVSKILLVLAQAEVLITRPEVRLVRVATIPPVKPLIAIVAPIGRALLTGGALLERVAVLAFAACGRVHKL